MNEKTKKYWLKEKKSRYYEGNERLKYDMEFVYRYITPGSVVCDLCCGEGFMTREMSKKAKLVYAVDINSNFLNEMRDLSNVVTVESDAVDYFCDQPLDLITVFGAIQYNMGEDVTKIYDNCYRMLKTGGWLLVSGQWGVKNTVLIDNFSEELQRHYFAEYRTMTDECNLLETIGFRTELHKILPNIYDRFDDTKFMCIVATKEM